MNQTKDETDQIPVNHWSNSIWFRTLFVTALVLGVFFRFSGLGNKMYSHDETHTSLHAAGFRAGEAFTNLWDGNDKSIEDIQKFLIPDEDKKITDTLYAVVSTGAHQAPLHFVLSHYWVRLFGYTPAAMRGLAAILGCLSILAMYWFSREFFPSSRTALLSTTLFALSPFHILFSQDARFYSLWTLATLVSSATFLMALRKNDRTTWLLYSLTVIFGFYSHLLFVLVVLVHGLFLVYVHRFRNPKVFFNYSAACLVALLAWAFWLFQMKTYWWRVAGQMDWVNIPTSWFRYIQRWILLFSSPLIDLDFNSDTANLIPYLLRVMILVFIVVAFLYLLKHGSAREKSFILLIYILTAGTFIALDLLFGGIRSTTGRYFVPANIATILVVAYFLSAKFDLAGNKTINRWKVLLGLLMLAGVFSNLNSLYSDTWWNKELGRVRTEFIQEINHDETLLIVSGHNATNLGDVLLLSLELDENVHFKLFRQPADIEYSGNYSKIYWFPSSYNEMQEISAQKQLLVREVLPGMLWQIEETSE